MFIPTWKIMHSHSHSHPSLMPRFAHALFPHRLSCSIFFARTSSPMTLSFSSSMATLRSSMDLISIHLASISCFLLASISFFVAIISWITSLYATPSPPLFNLSFSCFFPGGLFFIGTTKLGVEELLLPLSSPSSSSTSSSLSSSGEEDFHDLFLSGCRPLFLSIHFSLYWSNTQQCNITKGLSFTLYSFAPEVALHLVAGD
uniref:Uncharacterized protein n=1 Tax=Arundo donax TaxID=35708 RepID=A0A0A8YVE9_ARUDO